MAQEVAQVGENGLRDEAVAFGGGVDAVGLVQGAFAADAFEEERDERDVEILCELRVDFAELLRVFRSVVGGHHHAQEEDLCAGIAGFADYLGEVVAGGFDVEAAEAVVAAEADDEDVGGLSEEPVESAEAPGGRVAGDAGVDGVDADALLFEQLRSDGGERFVGGESEPCGDAVAEKDDAGQFRRSGGWCNGSGGSCSRARVHGLIRVTAIAGDGGCEDDHECQGNGGDDGSGGFGHS